MPRIILRHDFLFTSEQVQALAHFFEEKFRDCTLMVRLEKKETLFYFDAQNNKSLHAAVFCAGLIVGKILLECNCFEIPTVKNTVT